MKVKAYKLKDVKFPNWFTEVENNWHYRVFVNSHQWKDGWISFDCAVYLEEAHCLYLGLTSFSGDIFYGFDTEKKRFFSCGYERIKDKYDAKFQRSLEYFEKEKCLFGAVAQLHDIDNYYDAPGGALIRYDPFKNYIEKLCIPFKHVYIQSIVLDRKNGYIYGLTLIPEFLFRYEISTGKILELGPVGSCYGFAQGENIEIDDEGCVWCGWNILRPWQSQPGPDANRLCKYDSEKGRIIYFENGLENPQGKGFVKVEGLFNLGGNLFASGGNGSIFKVDKESGSGQYICTPVRGRRSRIASLRMAPDGYAYGVAGRDGMCRLIRFDPASGKYWLLGEIFSGQDWCWQVHDIAITKDLVIYACENDNPFRSSYLWEISL